MGLDMYLTKKTYVKNWNFEKPEDKKEVIVKIGGKEAKHIKKERISKITEDIGYWRKANAIHTWFVKNVQEGEDNCKEYHVSKEKLEELLKICETVIKSSIVIKGKIKNGSHYENGKEVPIIENGKYIKNPLIAKKLLPTESGFFFGGTDYDQYYVQNIEETIKIIKEALKDADTGDFYYQSNW